MRPVYWSKNLLLFLPAYIANVLMLPGVFAKCLAGFILFSFSTSAMYVFNDMADAEADRAHPAKRSRALASGAVSRNQGWLIACAFLSIAWPLAIWLSPRFGILLAVYCCLSLAYSLLLKRLLLIDTITLAGLHAFRLLLGAVLADVVMSWWLASFSLVFFFSLALAKRYSEVRQWSGKDIQHISKRPYGEHHKNMVLVLGTIAAVASVIVLALYATDYDFAMGFYHRPIFMWGAVAAVGMWLLHIWKLSHSGALTTDPVGYALTDRISLLLLLGLVFSVTAAKF